jgi:glutathione S-transferase
MKLFGHPQSGHAFKVRSFLTVAGIGHAYEIVDIFLPRDDRAAEFRENARFHQVPMLLDEDRAIVQSDAILMHLANKTGAWGAESPESFGLCTEWLFWEANRIGMCLPQLRASHLFSESRLTSGARNWLLDRYRQDVQRLDEELADGRPFIIGPDPTIAYISLSGYLYFADEAKVEVPDRVARWLETIAALPGWRHPYELMAA